MWLSSRLGRSHLQSICGPCIQQQPFSVHHQGRSCVIFSIDADFKRHAGGQLQAPLSEKSLYLGLKIAPNLRITFCPFALEWFIHAVSLKWVVASMRSVKHQMEGFDRSDYLLEIIHREFAISQDLSKKSTPNYLATVYTVLRPSGWRRKWWLPFVRRTSKPSFQRALIRCEPVTEGKLLIGRLPRAECQWIRLIQVPQSQASEGYLPSLASLTHQGI